MESAILQREEMKGMPLNDLEKVHNIRVKGVDSLKALLCFLIIILHTGVVGDTIFDPIVKAGVPGFLLITGFFYDQFKGALKNYIVRLGELILRGRLSKN